MTKTEKRRSRKEDKALSAAYVDLKHAQWSVAAGTGRRGNTREGLQTVWSVDALDSQFTKLMQQTVAARKARGSQATLPDLSW